MRGKGGVYVPFLHELLAQLGKRYGFFIIPCQLDTNRVLVCKAPYIQRN
jgi:hypothetical protein